jgi:RNA polymerase sigma factor (sigma-70 family)
MTKPPDIDQKKGAVDPNRVSSLPGDESDPTADSQRAFLTLLYSKYRSALFRYVNGIISSREETAELVQETYVRVMKRSQVMDFESSARNYLFETATNLARDHIRRSRHRRHDSFDETGEEFPDSSQQQPDQQLAWDQAIAALRSGVAAMPALTREIFVMGRLREMQYTEIARTLGVSLRTVERKMSEALSLLSDRVNKTL